MAVERPISHEATRADALLGGIGIHPDEAQAAALVLAGHATGADELRSWLETLGLLSCEPGGQLTWIGRPSKAKRKPKLNAPRCEACGYLVTAPAHAVMCDG